MDANMPRIALVALMALLAGCTDPAPAPLLEAPPEDPVPEAEFEVTLSGGSRLLIVSTQADGQGTSADYFEEGDHGFALPAGSRRLLVEAVIEDPPAGLDWELALHGECKAEPQADLHVVGKSPLRIELDGEALADAQCKTMAVLLQAADDAALPAAATFASRATWTAEVEHPVL